MDEIAKIERAVASGKLLESSASNIRRTLEGTSSPIAAQSIAPDPTYVMQYHCRSLEEYHRYRDNFAPALQKEHSDRFAGRFRGARQLLEEVAQATAAKEA